jgi:glycine cleavage system aminomethyltransferase T
MPGHDFTSEDVPAKQLICEAVLILSAGKMVPFAGWEMPIQYKDSIIHSSSWCRTEASIFDVSHMCGITLQVRTVTCRVQMPVTTLFESAKEFTLSCMFLMMPASPCIVPG